MRRPITLAVIVAALLVGSAAPASAVVHVTVPADDCAPAVSQAVSNATFEEQIGGLAESGTVALPLGGFKNAPTSCPAD